ncbi:MAG: hypothetical protein DCC52_17615, partial [Chloroflexi bacterium]
YTVNRIPEETFDELQKKSDGIARLGVLRMDVDNLGDLFSKGFGEDEKNLATLARISTLSFQLGLFFEGWVKKICAEPEYANLVYTVYAGGDDVFLIAPWSIVPGLARRIVDDLGQYTARNPDAHVSAGMAFIHGKYPVYQAAEDAHDALEQAKRIDDGKNAFSFLGQAWKWSEFEEVCAKFERLKKLVRAKGKKDETGQEGLGAPEALLQTFCPIGKERCKRQNKTGVGEMDLARRIQIKARCGTRARTRAQDRAEKTARRVGPEQVR